MLGITASLCSLQVLMSIINFPTTSVQLCLVSCDTLVSTIIYREGM